ncbi:MAG: hypothetical protein JWP66_772 [Naasia sp.]|nr:hypothetical protein [Naasia sp.]
MSAPDRREVRVRRSPRIGSFALTGALLAVVVTLVLTFAFPESGDFPRTQVFGYLLVILGTLGATLGAIVALVLDRVLARRARTVAAEREATLPAEPDAAPNGPASGHSGPTQDAATPPTEPGEGPRLS